MMTNARPSLLALMISLGFACAARPEPKDPDPGPSAAEASPTAEEAIAFLGQVDRELRRLSIAAYQADWNKQTDITPEHETAAAETAVALMRYTTSAINAARRFDTVIAELDAAAQRQFQLLRISGMPAPEDAARAAELAELGTRMESSYGKTKACDAGGKCRDLQELEKVLGDSRDPAELLEAWQGWHDAAGAAIAPMYPRFVELANLGARGVGFDDLGVLWRTGYDMPPADFEQELDRLWSQLSPLYRDLHCYARRRLSAHYGKSVVSPSGPIPAHLLGNMWAQYWSRLYPELEPYAKVAPLDVTAALERQNYDPIRMTKTAESFFMSLGLDPLPATFWERSMFTKPDGKEVVCHGSAWDVTFDDDQRIKMCIQPIQQDFFTIHHELGHNYYLHYYHPLPMLFQNGANDGFHEAVGDAIALSMTPRYLVEIGLLDEAVDNQKATINQQMRVALDKIAFLPFALVIDKWRWEVFSGKLSPADYNRHWWQLRRDYQGIEPAVSRDGKFDPGAKYHIPSNVPYMRYFLATILQFQFHRALCKKAGHRGPLYTCSIHGSKPAGDALRAMLAMGASRPWPDALEALTGERALDAGAMLEYFAPLRDWLAEANRGKACGW